MWMDNRNRCYCFWIDNDGLRDWEGMVTEILFVAIALLFVLTLVIINRNIYVQRPERKLAMARKELNQLRNDRQQPWLIGATTEYHLQKHITELEAKNEWLDKRCQLLQGTRNQLEAELDDWQESSRIILEEKCAGDEVHCLCVPVLRTRIKALEAHVPKSVVRRLDAQINE